jgi:hypothetical protein
MTRDTRLGLGREVHVTGGPSRRGLTVVERLNLAVRHAYDHEAAAADIAGFWMNNGEGKTDRHSGINRIAALEQDFLPDLTRNGTA